MCVMRCGPRLGCCDVAMLNNVVSLTVFGSHTESTMSLYPSQIKAFKRSEPKTLGVSCFSDRNKVDYAI